MKKIIFALVLVLISYSWNAQDRNTPVFSDKDSLNVYGNWETKTYIIKSGEEIKISYRFKVRKKFMLTCLFTVEVRNDSDKDFKAFFFAGNSGTNYYSGQIGVVKEKVKLKPKETVEVEYRLPTKTNSKQDTDAEVCKKCKEMEHVFTFAK